MTEPLRSLLPLAGAPQAALAPAIAGAKAARLAAALRAGLPVLPGWVVPVAAGAPALAAAAAAVSGSGMAAGRRAILRRPVDPGLAEELAGAVRLLGGRVIVRSSSPLESDPRWAGAFSSVTGVGPGDAATAVRSCWASAFAVDPLERLAECGLAPGDLELAVLLQPEIEPAAGGTARVNGAGGNGAGGNGAGVTVEGVAGHPGPLLSGWADSLLPGDLTRLIGDEAAAAVRALAARVHRELGDNAIEWALSDGRVWLLQSLRSGALPEPDVTAGDASRDSGPEVPGDATSGRGAHGPGVGISPAGGLPGGDVPDHLPAQREQMPLLAATVQARGRHLAARPAAPGTAAGRLVQCRPHERPPGDFRDAILLVDRPVPALAPLLFGARGLIARSGGAASHLAEVARSLGVPMVTGCRPETVTGTSLSGGGNGLSGDGGWLAAVDGSAGDVALLRR